MPEMLRVFDAICRVNDVDYFIDGGTLLGAMIWEGWIPWDGDIDVVVRKEHWAKLASCLTRESPPHL